ncbi:hypothetical protein NQ317_018539 [Molorchus minor]|uniref:Uncharacterized protein n=1 Tax=Molorchus minor TaxID=1323400 RepID=A0ABQ9JW08_9CUCU|nr:hypothetical protein NQ317_018539 [Molorchus minor]
MARPCQDDVFQNSWNEELNPANLWKKLNIPGDWSLITQQVGMVCSIPLNESQCERLIKKHHIYIFNSGWFSICAITPGNVGYIAKSHI